MKRHLLAFGLSLSLVAALAVGVLWLVMPALESRELTPDEVQAIEQHITERVEAKFGSEEIVTTDLGDCSGFYNLCFGSTTVTPRDFAMFSRTVFDTEFSLEQAECQPVGCSAVWRSDSSSVVITTFPEEFPGGIPDGEPLMRVRITPRSQLADSGRYVLVRDTQTAAHNHGYREATCIARTIRRAGAIEMGRTLPVEVVD